MDDDRNVFGTELEPCSTDPTTGYLRDGCCRRVDGDSGRHELCAVMTEAFLSFAAARGNDLVTPRPEFEFPGLEPGDRWCLCLGRWLEAVDADCAPPVVLEATHEAVLRDVDPDLLREHEYDSGRDEGGHERGGSGRSEIERARAHEREGTGPEREG